MYDIVIMPRAQKDMQDAVDWWKANRSVEQAESWYLKILAAIETLSHMPDRCRVIQGTERLGRDVHQLLFGVGSKPTHRIYFGIDGETVTIYRVSHTSQNLAQGQDDLV